MPIALTKFGRIALTRLSHLWMLSKLIPSDNSRYNERLHKEHEARKAEEIEQGREWVEQFLQPGQNVEDVVCYSGEDASVQNEPYTAALEKFVAESAVCRAVDSYHWYLRRVLEAALKRDNSLIQRWNSTLKLSPKKIASIESAVHLEDAVRGLFRGSEEPFRRLVHEYLGVPDLNVIPLVSRNGYNFG